MKCYIYVDVLMYVPIVYGFLPEINVFVFVFVLYNKFLSTKLNIKERKKRRYLLLSCYLIWSLLAYTLPYFLCHFWEIWAAFSPKKASLQLCRTTQLPNTSTNGTPHPQNLIKLSSEHTETPHNKGFSTTPAQSIGLQVYLLFFSSRRCAFNYACHGMHISIHVCC